MKKTIIVSGPVIVEDGKVLLDKQGEDDFWKFCGGKAREEEFLSETAIRRAQEELGITVEIIDPKPFLVHIKKESPDGDTDVILAHFLAKSSGEICPGEGVKEWQWFELNKLPDSLGTNILPVLRHFGIIR